MIQEKKRSKLPISIFLVLIGLGCIILGLGGYTFLFAKGYSYLLDDPRGVSIAMSCVPNMMRGNIPRINRWRYVMIVMWRMGHLWISGFLKA